MALTHQETNGTTATEDYVERLLFSLTSLTEVGSLLTSEGSFQNAAEAGLRSTMGALTATSGALLVFDSSKGELALLASRGLSEPAPVIPSDETLWRFLIDHKTPVPVGKKSSRPSAFRHLGKTLSEYRSQLWIPLVVNEELLGVLSLGEKLQRSPFEEEDLKLLQVLGHHFSVSLLNQRLMSDAQGSNFQLNRKVVELETLYDAGLSLSSSLEVEDVIEEVLLLTVGILDARGGCLILKDERTGRFGLVH
jgi:GAF domain-containing protein